MDPARYADLLAGSSGDRVLEAARAAVARGVRGTFYRGIRFAAGTLAVAADEFLPGPRTGATEARFNEPGQPALYLADRLPTVEAEVPPEPGRPELFVQRFDLKWPAARIVVVPPMREDGLLAELLAACDESGTYLFCHAIRRAADMLRCDGIQWPSVADGDGKDPRTRNLAVISGRYLRLLPFAARGPPTPYEAARRQVAERDAAASG